MLVPTSIENTAASSSMLTLGDLITYAYDKMSDEYTTTEDLNLAVALWLEEVLEDEELWDGE